MIQKPKTPTILSQRVKLRLDALGITPHAAAIAINKNESFVRDILRLRVRSPGAEAMVDLARVLQCSTDYLLGLSDDVGMAPVEMPAVIPARRGRYDSFPLFVRHDVAAGVWLEFDLLMQAEPEESPLRSDPRWPADQQWASRLVGPSMNEVYGDGSIVSLVSVFALRGYEPRDGQHVEVVRKLDGGHRREITLKQVQVNDDGTVDLICRSTDPRFRGVKIPYRDGVDPADDEASVEIVALVTGSYKRVDLDL